MLAPSFLRESADSVANALESLTRGSTRTTSGTTRTHLNASTKTGKSGRPHLRITNTHVLRFSGGESAETYLYQWLRWFDDNGFKLTVEDNLDPIGDFISNFMLGKHKLVRMVKTETPST